MSRITDDELGDLDSMVHSSFRASRFKVEKDTNVSRLMIQRAPTRGFVTIAEFYQETQANTVAEVLNKVGDLIDELIETRHRITGLEK